MKTYIIILIGIVLSALAPAAHAARLAINYADQDGSPAVIEMPLEPGSWKVGSYVTFVSVQTSGPGKNYSVSDQKFIGVGVDVARDGSAWKVVVTQAKKTGEQKLEGRVYPIIHSEVLTADGTLPLRMEMPGLTLSVTE